MKSIHPIDLIQPIRDRWSPKLFAEQPVPEEVLVSLFEAARWAPSSFNGQPWRFIVANRHEDPEAFDRMLSLLTTKNQSWAKYAPILFLSVAEVESTWGPNRHAWHDVGLAMGNLLAQATAQDVFVRQMAGFDRVKAQQILDIPVSYEPVVMSAMGYRETADELDGIRNGDPNKRLRKDLNDIVFTNQWRNVL